MSVSEAAFLFDCQGDSLPGILASAGPSPTLGVLIVVGGPQYRVGSHRQFVRMARALADDHTAVMRFDVRGMGDGEGAQRSFDMLDPDIMAAINAFKVKVPTLERVVLLGLCDGATAAVLHAASGGDVDGLMLLNPWVQTAPGISRAALKHYYVRRFADRSLWRKLVSGQVGIRGALREFAAGVVESFRLQPDGGVSDTTLPERFVDAMEAAHIQTLVILSGNDFVAREFEDSVLRLSGFKQAVDAGWAQVTHLPGADHTFSISPQLESLITNCRDWLRMHFAESGD